MLLMIGGVFVLATIAAGGYWVVKHVARPGLDCWEAGAIGVTKMRALMERGMLVSAREDVDEMLRGKYGLIREAPEALLRVVEELELPGGVSASETCEELRLLHGFAPSDSEIESTLELVERVLIAQAFLSTTGEEHV